MMCRKVKYKAWDRDTMWNVRSINFDTETVYIGLHDEFIDNITLLEYTGLKDKNGEEIFEGDVVKYDDGDIAKVIFKDGGFCGYYGGATSSDEVYLLLVSEETPFSGYEFEVEVIGNIYQNPELIK